MIIIHFDEEYPLKTPHEAASSIWTSMESLGVLKKFWGFDLEEQNCLSVKHLYTCSKYL